ncbi:MAG: hypothetical protein ACRELD_13400, partial [Longimicrobiales bacterium]
SAVARNASEGRGALEQLVLPLGFARLYLRTGPAASGPARAHVALDLPSLLATAYFAFRRDAELDLIASLSAGTPVFATRVRWADGYWAGDQVAGVIWLRGNPDDPTPDAERGAVLAHERVHVLQYDFSFLLWSDPAERWLAERVAGGAWIERRLDLGLHLAPWALANRLLPYELRPWEQEAYFLSRVR